MRFLIVDDSSTMRRIIINTLNKLGYKECHEAANGREGVERLATTQVDIVITDWNMPNMTGTEFTKALRARPDCVVVDALEGATVPLPQADRPPTKDQALYQDRCGSTGNYEPGSVNGGTTDPCLYPEPTTSYDGTEYGWDVRPFHPETGPREHRKRDAVLGSGMSVKDHRDQHDGISKKNSENRLPPVHATFDQRAR